MSSTILTTAVLLLLFSMAAASTTLVLAHAGCGVDADMARSVEEDLARNDREGGIKISALATKEAERRAAGVWEPIRITTSFLDVDDPAKSCSAAGEIFSSFDRAQYTCFESDLVNAAKRTIIKNAVAKAVMRLQETVNVERIVGGLRASTSTICSGGFTLPAAALTTDGMADTDLLVLVAAGPAPHGVLAWAGGCARNVVKDVNAPRRIVIGRLNIDPSNLLDVHERDLVATILHEFFHIFGFISSEFTLNGLMLQTKTFRDRMKSSIVSTRALATARNFFACEGLTGIELEDEGSYGTSGSNHLDARIYPDDMMSGGTSKGISMSVLSLTILDDLLVYRTNKEKADPTFTGKFAGCSFHTTVCPTGQGFCKSQYDQYGCSPDYLGYSPCTVSVLSDGCRQYLRWVSCFDSIKQSSNNITGNSFADNARCFNTSFTSLDDSTRCLLVQCDASFNLRVAVAGSASGYVACPAGAAITYPGYDFTIYCPASTEDVCRSASGIPDTSIVAPGAPSTPVPPLTESPNAAGALSTIVCSAILGVVCVMLFAF